MQGTDFLQLYVCVNVKCQIAKSVSHVRLQLLCSDLCLCKMTLRESELSFVFESCVHKLCRQLQHEAELVVVSSAVINNSSESHC